jgi:DNA-binding NarL/FixJ family response regulator
MGHLSLQKRKINQAMINVHITDDHAMVVELLIPVINASGIARVTGSSFKLSECRKALTLNRPDVLLLDINMTDGDGIIFCSEMHKMYPEMKIIGLTGRDEYSSVMLMLKNGASGYILKSEAVSEVLEAINAVMRGETYISSRIEQIMRKTTQSSVSLTPRERQVLQLVAKGMSNPQIVEQLGIGLATVHSFRKKLNLKLNASNPVELVVNARKKGLLE